METSQSSGVRQRDIKDIDKAIRDIRPSTAVITKISPSGDDWLKKSMNIDIREILKVQTIEEIYEKINEAKNIKAKTLMLKK